MTDSPPPLVARAASWPLEFVLVAGYAVLFAGCGLVALAVGMYALTGHFAMIIKDRRGHHAADPG